jgi:hypothetical protein
MFLIVAFGPPFLAGLQAAMDEDEDEDEVVVAGEANLEEVLQVGVGV